MVFSFEVLHEVLEQPFLLRAVGVVVFRGDFDSGFVVLEFALFVLDEFETELDESATADAVVWVRSAYSRWCVRFLAAVLRLLRFGTCTIFRIAVRNFRVSFLNYAFR